jgi:hypothetical protein
MRKLGGVVLLVGALTLAACSASAPPTQDELRDNLVAELEALGGATDGAVVGMLNTIAGDMLTQDACASSGYRSQMQGDDGGGKLLAAFDATCEDFFH